ncbi:D-hexose-6-phosphate mutarotase [Denitratisoma sp. agr-D3]
MLLKAESGAEAVISRLGAQVLSWKTGDGKERLFLSERAVFDGSRSIRGGIPVCFPQFSGLGELPKHGLLRQKPWTVVEQAGRRGFAMACLATGDDDATRALWPHRFSAELTVVLEGSRLDVELAVENTDLAPFSFTAALHTYLRVKEVENVHVRGLQGLEYRDAARGDAIVRDNAEELTVDDEVDRVYHGVSKPVLLSDGGVNLGIDAEGFPDLVVWNPWETRCAALPDMAPLEFRRMLCIEAAAARQPVLLPAGETWLGRQTLVAV